MVYNLLRVGHLLNSGYIVLFAKGGCVIKDLKADIVLVWVKIPTHILFPLVVGKDGGAVNAALGT